MIKGKILTKLLHSNSRIPQFLTSSDEKSSCQIELLGQKTPINSSLLQLKLAYDQIICVLKFEIQLLRYFDLEI